MNAWEMLDLAERHRQRCQNAIAPLRSALVVLLESDSVDVFYQPGDGWCILFGDDENAPVGSIDFTLLFEMSRDNAIAYLKGRGI
jgi:hypothetical protein